MGRSAARVTAVSSDVAVSAPALGAAADDRWVEHGPAARRSLGVLSLVSLVLGILGVTLHWTALRWPALLVFCVVGIGSAPWQLNARLGLASRLVVSALTSFAVWTLVPSAMAATGFWYPGPFSLVVAVACGGLHLFALVRLRHEWPAHPIRQSGAGSGFRSWTAAIPGERWGAVLPWLLPAAGVLLSMGAALTHRHIDPGYGGFAVEIGVWWYAGLALLLAAFLIWHTRGERYLGTCVALVLLVLVLTPAIVYDGPPSQSAFKHIDLVAQIQQTGLLHSAVPVYTAWPGFFASMAWLCDVIGLKAGGFSDSLHLTIFWPPFIGVFRLLVLRYLAGQWLRDPLSRWVAVLLVVLADAVEADYFSPQSVGYVLAFLIIGLALSRDLGRARLPMILLGGCTMALTHQLSPYVAAGVLVVLVVFRQVRPWYTPLLVLVPAAGWTLAHADALVGQLSLGLIGEWSNFRPPETVAAPGLSRSPMVTATSVALVLGILLVGFLAFRVLLSRWREPRAWAAAVAPAVGLALLAVTPYGQEGIFRAALFGIPWLALLAARLFSSRRGAVPRRGQLAAVLVGLMATYLVTTTGVDGFTTTRPSDVAALDYAATQSPGRYALLRLAPGDVPTSVRPGQYSLQPTDLGVSPQELNKMSAAQQVRRLTGAYVLLLHSVPASDQPDLYAMWSPVEVRYADAYGLAGPARLAALKDAFLRSPYWDSVLQEDGTELFRLDVPALVEGGR